MEERDMAVLAYEKIDGSGSGRANAAYLLVMTLLVAGMLMLFTASGKGGLAAGVAAVVAAVVAACLGYFRLLRSAPKHHYFVYCWLDRHGLHHIEGNSPTDHAAHFAWSEILGARASACQDEVKGLILTLERPGMRGVPVFLPMAHADEAAAAINGVVGTSRRVQDGGAPVTEPHIPR